MVANIIAITGWTAVIEAATVALGQAGVGISALVPLTATLEELFLGMTEGEQAAGAEEAVA